MCANFKPVMMLIAYLHCNCQGIGPSLLTDPERCAAKATSFMEEVRQALPALQQRGGDADKAKPSTEVQIMRNWPVGLNMRTVRKSRSVILFAGLEA